MTDRYAKKIVQLTVACLLLSFSSTEASIIKIPPAVEAVEKTYAEFPCSAADFALISELITTLSESGKVNLLFNQTRLKQIGAAINHVHPLKFLAMIFKTPRLKACMPEILNDYFKGDSFMEGLGAALQRESEKGKLDKHIADFAADVNVPVEQLRPFFQARDWNNLLRFLMLWML